MNCDNCGGGIQENASEHVYIDGCVYHAYCVPEEEPVREIRERGVALGEYECQCPTCLRVFTGEKPFEAHLMREQGKLRCMEPKHVGLNLDWKGRWTAGSGEKRKPNWETN